MSAVYERELRDILRKDGWIVIRSAGSFAFDITALKPNEHQLIEVKSTKADNANINHDQRARDQFDVLNEYAKQGFNCYYYIRWKRRKPKWSKYKLPIKSYPKFLHASIKKSNILIND